MLSKYDTTEDTYIHTSRVQKVFCATHSLISNYSGQHTHEFLVLFLYMFYTGFNMITGNDLRLEISVKRIIMWDIYHLAA